MSVPSVDGEEETNVSFYNGTDHVAMNESQWNAIEALRVEYPEPMVVGWRGSLDPTTVVRGSVFATVEDDEQGRDLGRFTIDPSGDVRWLGAKP